MEIPLLKDIVIIFGLAVAVIFVCHRIKIPAIVGFLITGLLAGPHGLKLVRAVHEVEILAEIGVILLLFTIGIEFSLKNLLKIKKSVLIGGSLQVLLTIVSVFVIAVYMGQTFNKSVFIGFLISLSSTAIVLKIFQERAEIDSPQGQTSLAVLIFQDLIIVPMMLLIPLLSGAEQNLGKALFTLVTKGIGIIILVIVSAEWIIPRLLYQITRTRSRELFLLSVVGICLAVAWLTYRAGLSLGLGAFLAGLIISESEYSHQTLGNILPFRDVFTSFFFVSIGMLLNVGFFIQHITFISMITLSVLSLKAIIVAFVVLLLGFPLRTSILVGLALCQIGEFSFILSRTGMEFGLLNENIYQMFLAVSVLTMMLTPFIIHLSPYIVGIGLRLPLPERLKSGMQKITDPDGIHKKDHLIIIGFGINGRNVARAARVGRIPYVIIEINPETVKKEKEKRKESIFYGDATHEAVLQHADIKNARIVVVAINDPSATRRIIEIVRQLNPNIYIIVRTRYLKEMKPLYDLGANEVIPEEFETSVEIFTRVLNKYLIPKAEIEKFANEIRLDNYQIFRGFSIDPTYFCDLKFHIPDIEIITFRVEEGSPVEGKTLANIELRKKYGVTLLAIRRNYRTVPNPHGDMEICPDDVLILMASPERIAGIADLFLTLK
ncbi:MAG: cation:proton antiporter [Thermodesulfobacteriota bacterium]|nr:cation:proton antiporter [Thermodesulfobacteriota bacterium]